ncbi:MAG: cohesin domain-containing protein [Verrucomicrobiia bacterium]
MGSRVSLVLILAFSLPAASPEVSAESVADHAVQVSATVQSNPPRITLTWPGDTQATNYFVYRKSVAATSWGVGTTLPGNAVSYVDEGVTVGSAYEYKIHKGAIGYSGFGYIWSGIEVPLVEHRGKVLLLVDNSFSASLAPELARLEEDLVGDGWTVSRHDLPRMATNPADTGSDVWAARASELAAVKALIQGEYNADPANVRAVFLLGHLPVPYAGDMGPDYHVDHRGAWPADVFYGDVNGTWTDTRVNNVAAADLRNRNVPGDGKFDQSSLPSSAELQVGRVDFADLPAFASSESELLRRYLNKNHAFRHGSSNPGRCALIDDHLGLLRGEVPAATGWRNFAPLFGTDNVVAADWLTTLDNQSYLWGYGCGGGTFTSCGGVATVSELAAGDPQVVFAMLLGSYFGDWDSQNNLVRAALATPGYTLTCSWAGRPFWMVHHMAMGETIGFSARLTQNNLGVYNANAPLRSIHIALMGDPTLRMLSVRPPAELTAKVNRGGGVDLGWEAAKDTVVGYHVYRAPTAAGPYTRINSDFINANTYFDPVPGADRCYMVRAVKLELSGSGSYFNASQGIIQMLSTPSSVNIAGTTRYYAGNGLVPGVTLQLSGDDSQTVVSGSDGQFLFAVPPGSHYTVTPSMILDVQPSQAVNTRDITVIRRHILGLSLMDSAYKLIAGDADGNGSVNTRDITLIRRLILGIGDTLPAGLWKFVPSEFEFPDSSDPWTPPFPTSRDYPNVISDFVAQDFTAVKTGDVDGSWASPAATMATGTDGETGESTAARLQTRSAALSRSLDPGRVPPVLSLGNTSVRPGETLVVPVAVTSFQGVTGLQFTLEWDPDVLQFLSVGDLGLPGLNANCFNGSRAGKLSFAWDDPSTFGARVRDAEPICSIQFRAIGPAGSATSLAFHDSPTPRMLFVIDNEAAADWRAGTVEIAGAANPAELGIRLDPSGGIRIAFTGTASATYSIQTSETLSNLAWLVVATCVADPWGSCQYIVRPDPGSPARFYRVVRP